ncbi:MAG: ABC transporter substrate-binding protein [Anaerolineales bacterium]
MRTKFGFCLLLAAWLAACGGGATPTSTASTRMLIGVLPIPDTLPMYVAEAKGYFTESNLDVVFVPVASTAERDRLMQLGQIDAMINDLVDTLLNNKNQISIIVVGTARTATAQVPLYRVVAAAGSGIETIEGLRGVEIGMPEESAAEYVTHRLLEAAGFGADDILIRAVPNPADAVAMLASGELSAATLPEPAALLAIQGGARVILDDTSHPEVGQSLISFGKSYLTNHRREITAFLAAIERAATDIHADGAAWNDLLVQKELVPAALVESYTLPTFPSATVPTEAQFADVLAWALERGLVLQTMTYSLSIDPSFLP